MEVLLFICSSIKDKHLDKDREQLTLLEGHLNNIHREDGIRFYFRKSDYYDNQAAIDNEIKKSDLVIFLFNKKVGKATRGELKITQKESGAPGGKLDFSIYMRNSIPKRLEKHLIKIAGKKYCKKYSNSIELENCVLKKLLDMKCLVRELNIKDNVIYYNGMEFSNISEVAALLTKENISNLKQKKAELTKRAAELASAGEQARADYLAAQSELRKTEDELNEAIENSRAAMFDLNNVDGLSDRQREAQRIAQSGNFEGALSILDPVYIEKNHEVSAKLAENTDEQHQITVNEYLDRVKYLKAMPWSADVRDKIYSAYEKAYELTVKYNLDKGFIFDYAKFLSGNINKTAAARVGEKLRFYQSDPDAEYSDIEKAAVCRFLGNVYGGHTAPKYKITHEQAEEFKKAKERCNEAIGIYEKNPDRFASEIAHLYNRLGWVIYMESLAGSRESLECFDKAAKINQNRDKLLSAHLATNSANWYNTNASNRGVKDPEYPEYFKAALRKYREAEAIYLDIEEKQPGKCYFDIAKLYYNIGIFYNEAEKYAPDMLNKAAEYYSMALRRFEALYNINPLRYAEDYGHTCVNCANNYFLLSNYEKAAAYYECAYKVYSRLAETNESKYGQQRDTIKRALSKTKDMI